MEINPDTNDVNVFRFCGEYYDTETGTVYLRARYYDPSIGRFISRDSFAGNLADPLSLNLYTYCANNPLLYVDPSGHSLKDILKNVKKVANEVIDFGKTALKETAKEISESAGTYAFAATVTQVDSPALGPGDIIGGGIAGKELAKNIFKGVGTALLLKFGSEIAKNIDISLDTSKSKDKDVNQKKTTLYHYTNYEGLNGILSTNIINPSLKANNSKDAHYGDGQYLSDLNPVQYTAVQLAATFIHVPNKYKYTHYIEIDVTGLNVVECRNHVYLIPNSEPLDITGRIVSAGIVGDGDDY